MGFREYRRGKAEQGKPNLTGKLARDVELRDLIQCLPGKPKVLWNETPERVKAP